MPLNRLAEFIGIAPNERDGPLPALLLTLTVATGLVDAISFLRLGHVFVANMTGNIVFLGFAAAGASGFSISASLTALAVFMCGALAGGRMGAGQPLHRGRYLGLAIGIEALLVFLALLVSLWTARIGADAALYALIVTLGFAMGLQNAVARRLGVPDITTTVLTLTLAGLAADSPWAGGKNPNPARRLAVTAAMFVGAAVGACLIAVSGITAVLGLTLGLLLIAAAAIPKAWSSTEKWTEGASR